MAAAQQLNTSQIDAFFAEYVKGIQTVVDAGRQAVDKAAAQNGEAVTALKSGLTQFEDAWQKSAQAQQAVSAVMVERVQTVSRLVTENVESVAKTLTGLASALQVPATLVASAQKQATEFVAAQKSALDAATQQVETSSKAALETFHRGVETVIEAQKSALKRTHAA
ncbi:MAG: hypothetical protein AB7K63_20710 [Vicinamibacterales bacterium]